MSPSTPHRATAGAAFIWFYTANNRKGIIETGRAFITQGLWDFR